MSAVAKLIDAVVRCTICGKPPGCKCWVRLRCACGRTLMVQRESDDADAEEIATECPECAE